MPITINKEQRQAAMAGDAVEPITPLALLGTGVAVSFLAYWVFTLFK